MVIVEKLVEWRLAGETEVLGENLPQRQFCPSQNPTWLDPGLNPGRRGGKPETNLLSYGAALVAGLAVDAGVRCDGPVSRRYLLIPRRANRVPV
jgi:hypothetical protein